MPAPLTRYFVSKTGDIYIPPDSATRCPPHCNEHLCHSIRDVESLVRRMEQRALDDADRAGIRHQIVWEEKVKSIRDSLFTKMASSGTSAYEREFIELWLKLSDERKKQRYAELFEHRRVIAEGLEFDKPKTREQIEEEIDHGA